MQWIIAVGSTVKGGVRRGIELVRERFAVIGESDVHVTPASGGVTSLPFENGAIVIETALHPAALLAALHAIEARAGRVRSERNAARALDLDVVWGLELVAPLANPAVPHPRALERPFVIKPACEALARAGIAVPTALLSASVRACAHGWS